MEAKCHPPCRCRSFCCTRNFKGQTSAKNVKRQFPSDESLFFSLFLIIFHNGDSGSELKIERAMTTKLKSQSTPASNRVFNCATPCPRRRRVFLLVRGSRQELPLFSLLFPSSSFSSLLVVQVVQTDRGVGEDKQVDAFVRSVKL